MDKANEVMKRLSEVIFSSFEKAMQICVAPICFEAPNGEMIPDRSGVLIRIGEYSFLVTAAHNFKETIDADYTPCIMLPEEGTRPVLLGAEIMYSTKNKIEDITIILLDAATVSTIEKHFNFVRLNNMMSRFDKKHEDAMYMVTGFSKQLHGVDDKGNKCVGCWRYLTSAYRHDLKNVENYDPTLHIILGYETASSPGNPEQIHPPGMSGCGVWFIGGPQAIKNCLRFESFDPTGFQLVGIDTAWHRKHEYIKGTWIDLVLEIIWRYFPDTHAPMRLHNILF